MAKISNESMELCQRVDSMLDRATKDPDGFYDYAIANSEIVKYAFLARAVVRGLINPLPELFTSISEIEVEFSEYANQTELVQDDEEESKGDEEEVE